MSIKIITNEAARDAVEYRLTNTSNTTAITGQDHINITGGARYDHYQEATTTGRRFIYANKGQNLGANAIAIINADKLSGHDIAFGYQTTFGTDVNISSYTNFSETLIGPNSQDYVEEFSAVSGKEGLYIKSTGSDNPKRFSTVMFGTAFEIASPSSVRIEPWSRDEPIITPDGAVYRVEEKITLSFYDLTNSDVQTFDGLYKIYEQPCYLYDSAEEWIPYKGAHVIVSVVPIEKRFHDLHDFRVEAYRLEEYLQ